MVTWLGGLVVPVLVIAAFLLLHRLAESVPLLRHASRPWYWRSRSTVQALVVANVALVTGWTAWYVHRETTFGRQLFVALWGGGISAFVSLPRSFRALRRWDRRHARLVN